MVNFAGYGERGCLTEIIFTFPKRKTGKGEKERKRKKNKDIHICVRD